MLRIPGDSKRHFPGKGGESTDSADLYAACRAARRAGMARPAICTIGIVGVALR